MVWLDLLITYTDFGSDEPAKTACHKGELQIGIDYHDPIRREGFQVLEINPISDVAFDNHPLSITLDEPQA